MSVPDARYGDEAVNDASEEPTADYALLRLGPRLKSLRHQRGLTLEAVARGTQLSVSFLSLLENNKSDISLARLQRIAHFYDLNISDLLADETREVRRVVRLREASRIVHPEEGIVSYSLAIDPRRSMDPFYSTMEPGAHYAEPVVHPGEEFRHVLEGHVRIRIGVEPVYDLYPGDTIYHPSDIPHYYENVGSTKLRMIGCTRREPSGGGDIAASRSVGGHGESR